MTIELINLLDASEELFWQIREWRNQAAQYFILDNIDKETHQNWLDNKLKKHIDHAFLIYCDNKPQGCIYIRNVDLKNKIAEYGIFLKPDSLKGRKLGTHATYKILQYCFEELHLEKVYLEVFTFNHHAIALYKKFNFVTEGNLRNQIVKNNHRVDLQIMGLLKPEWDNIKNNFKVI